MKIGLVGLGKMGYNLALNLKNNKLPVHVYDINASSTKQMSEQGFGVASSLSELANSLSSPRIVWLLVPAGSPVDDCINTLQANLEPGDIIVDAGNSHYKDSIRRAEQLSASGILFLDCGTSGGVSGALSGICAMVGGSRHAFEICEKIFKAICVENGYYYCGDAGSGHFIKMVHNGIEYGMMQSIAEGFELMNHSEYNFDHEAIAGLWNHGSVIRGWLMELTQQAFSKDPKLDLIRGVMHSSGEGKWMVETALEKNISTPVIALSLLMRYRSQQNDTFSGKVVAALRYEFGGHAVNKIPGKTSL